MEAPDGTWAVRFKVVNRDDEWHRAYLTIWAQGPAKDFEEALQASKAPEELDGGSERSRALEKGKAWIFGEGGCCHGIGCPAYSAPVDPTVAGGSR